MKRIIVLFVLLVVGCSTDPLNQTYTKAEGVQPLLSDKIDPPIDKGILALIKEAELTNDRNGIANEGKTFKELFEQGFAQAEQRRMTEQMTDSLAKEEAK